MSLALLPDVVLLRSATGQNRSATPGTVRCSRSMALEATLPVHHPRQLQLIINPTMLETRNALSQSPGAIAREPQLLVLLDDLLQLMVKLPSRRSAAGL